MSIDPLQPPLFPAMGAPGVAAGVRATAGQPFADALAGAQAPADKVAVEDEPTHDAMAAVQVAARAYEQLRETGRELRFQNTDIGMQIEVYDGSGRLVRRIPPNEALALATAKGTAWLA